MHRSGTSLVTRALQALGVSLGENLSIEASPDNAKGHWEDRDVLAFNERLMAALALEWDVIGEADDALMAAPSLGPLVDEARSLVASKAIDDRAWAFKDPRTARLWPFWRRVFSGDAPAKPQFVWVIRHPRPVALSLTGRNGFAPREVASALVESQHRSVRGHHGRYSRGGRLRPDTQPATPRTAAHGRVDALAGTGCIGRR